MSLLATPTGILVNLEEGWRKEGQRMVRGEREKGGGRDGEREEERREGRPTDGGRQEERDGWKGRGEEVKEWLEEK